MVKPWHRAVQLREDVRTGELSLSDFAADLYDVVMGKGPLVYRDTTEFFSLTYPTLNLRELARDVALRLAGKNDKAIRQLELIYGGGKTHTLITLYHLTYDPRNLPESTSADDFVRHIGQLPPKARIAVLAFDKLDPEKGIEVRGPDNTVRKLYEPWSVLAYQLAGSDGLKILHGQGLDEERSSAPAEPLLVELLSMPERQGLAPLILIDEVLMYVRGKVWKEPLSRGNILNFFQYLTQAATKIKNCAIVASLLATDPEINDPLGKELTNQLSAIFRRELEQTVEPVVKEDVAEVLRRRFFDPKSFEDRKTMRNAVISVVKNIAALDEQTEKTRHQAEERFQHSYPFHPDLTEVLYAKWTQLEGFQRTRGILRIFAQALRDAEKWDQSPIISTNVFLNDPDKSTLADAARELTNVAETEEYEGKRQQWTSILEGELARARDIQSEIPVLHAREIEQAVFATFLHSQPIGKKAQTGELLSLIGASGPQKIDIEKALRRWMEISWFLDESAFYDDKGLFIAKGLPGFWRLGALPNLRQMHHEASEHVPASVIETSLLTEIRHCKALTEGTKTAGARAYLLPAGPREVEDDGNFQYVVLGPDAASRSVIPSTQAKRYILERTTAETRRIYRNAVIVVVPSSEGLEALRNAIRRHQGWIDVRNQLKGQNIDNSRVQLMAIEEKQEAQRITALVRQAYNIVVTLSEKEDKQDDVIAFRLVASDEPLFNVIKQDLRSRIRESAVTAEALLPDGPYCLWHEGDTEYRVNDLALAFAQYARLPKMLNSRAIVQTLLDGCSQGHFVLRSDRGDGSSRTYWYDDVPPIAEVRKFNLSVVLSKVAQLTVIPFYRLAPNTVYTLPKLWQGEELRMAELYRYFDGCTVSVAYAGYSEPLTIPKAARNVVNQAVQQAVRDRQLWLLYGSASFYGEDVPDDLLLDDAILQGPPPVIAAREIMPDALPDAWSNGSVTNAEAIREALTDHYEKVQPWLTVRTAIENALRSRFIERTIDSGYFPCSAIDASRVKLSLRQEAKQKTVKQSSTSYSPAQNSFGSATNGTEHNTRTSESSPDTMPGRLIAEATLQDYELQDLVEHIAQIGGVCGDLGIPSPTFHVRIAFDAAIPLTNEQLERLNRVLRSASERFAVTFEVQ